MSNTYAALDAASEQGQMGSSETSRPPQHLGIALVALIATTTTGVPAQPVLDSQIVCESFTGTWRHDAWVPQLSSALIASAIEFESITENSTAISAPIPAPTMISTADSVKRIRADSGLTWDQLARLFGVSRRAVHHWASGGRMNAVNEEHLNEIQEVIRGLPGKSPEDRRSLILASSEGTSIFEQLKSKRPASEVLQVPAHSPDSLVG